MFGETFLSEDRELPDRIEHGCDIIVGDGGELEQYYNYLVYFFSGLGHGLWARSYLDEIRTVTLHGYAAQDKKGMIQPEAFDCPKGREILQYLYRRYAEVRMMSNGAYITLARPE